MARHRIRASSKRSRCCSGRGTWSWRAIANAATNPASAAHGTAQQTVGRNSLAGATTPHSWKMKQAVRTVARSTTLGVVVAGKIAYRAQQSNYLGNLRKPAFFSAPGKSWERSIQMDD